MLVSLFHDRIESDKTLVDLLYLPRQKTLTFMKIETVFTQLALFIFSVDIATIH